MLSFPNSARGRRFFVLGFSLAAAVCAAAAPTLPGVGPAMQRVVDAHEVAGAVTAVATKDKIIHLEATGLADLTTKKPMETNATFWLASVTKPFTAVAALMLQDEGKLKLSDPVAKYLPQFASLKTPSGKPANLTLQHLLTHTSGLSEIKRGAYATVGTLAETIDGYFPAAPMLYEPGERWKWPGSVQVLEVTPPKKVVWALRSWSEPADLGPATVIQLIDQPGIPENRGQSR